MVYATATRYWYVMVISRRNKRLTYNSWTDIIVRDRVVVQKCICFIVFTCVSYAEARNRYRLDVRLSVCPSVTRWHCIKTTERIVMISSPHDSPFILVLCIPRSSRNSDGITHCGGAKYRWGIKFARWFFTNKSLYLANDTRYRHGCYGRRIENHTQAFWMASVSVTLSDL